VRCERGQTSLSGTIDLVRGMYVCVPRNMTQAAGFYNTLLEGDDPAMRDSILQLSDAAVFVAVQWLSALALFAAADLRFCTPR